MHGHGTEACRHLKQMCEEGLQVDDVSFVCLLSTCSHAGLVDEGICYFNSIGSVYKISARAEHYTCMVDLLGHAGCLHEVEDMINTMSCTPNVDMWKALLGACRFHGNVEMGEHVAMQVLELGPWKCHRVCAAIKHQCSCWQAGPRCKSSTAKKGKRSEEVASLHLD